MITGTYAAKETPETLPMAARLLITISIFLFSLVASPVKATSFTIAATGSATLWAATGSTSGQIPIESQSGSASGNYTFVFSFASPLVNVSHATLASGIGSVTSSMIDPSDPTKYIVNLSGVTDAQYLTITLSGISGGGAGSTLSGSVGILIGDTTGDGRVNSADVSYTQMQSGSVLSSSNFRADVTGNGRINSADVSLVQSMSGTALPSFLANPNRPEFRVPDNGPSALLLGLSILALLLAQQKLRRAEPNG